MYRWMVLFTKPRKERTVLETLEARGLDAYLPRLVFHTRRGNLVEQPYFPRYLFARLDWEAAGVADVRWTPGLTSVVTFHGQPAWLPDDKMAYLRDRIDHLDGDAFLRLRGGERIRVRRGPFADLEVILDGYLNGESRVAVLLRILGRDTRVLLRADDVERPA